MYYIYKITNIVNNKVYIGLTTISIEYRWGRHKTASKDINNNKHLYRAMRKYGIDKFKIEEIDSTDDFEKLGELERYYIKKYNSMNPDVGYNLTAGGEKNQYDGNPAAVLSVEDVINIRELYKECKLSLSQCWTLYKDKISYSAFQKVWLGETWQGISMDVYTKENKEKHRSLGKAHPGVQPVNMLYSNEEYIKIQQYFSTHTAEETYNKLGSKSKNLSAFKSMLMHPRKNVPYYKKRKKKWFINNQEININEFLKPVSTISGSGE